MRHAAGISLFLCLLCGLYAVSSAGAAHAGSRAPAPATGASRMEAIVRTWSARLNANDNAGVAALFSLPATMFQAPFEYRLVNRHQIAEWEAELPCSGTVVSIAVKGRFATAVFKLGNRGATKKCDAPPGTLAAARFGVSAARS